MKAVVWHGTRDVRTEQVPEPRIERPDDVLLRITSSGLCGSDLHLYEVLGPFMHEGEVLGHEPMGVVEETGAEVTSLRRGDRVVIPFQISCGRCAMCRTGLQTQCEATRVEEQGMGARIYGYSSLYGSVPGAQAQYLRVPRADQNALKVPDQGPDDRYVRRGGTVSVIGVYGGMADPLPMMTLFDKQIQLRMGQANVRHWAPEILPLLDGADPLGVEDFATHHLGLDEAAHAYAMFQRKEEGAVKVLFRP